MALTIVLLCLISVVLGAGIIALLRAPVEPLRCPQCQSTLLVPRSDRMSLYSGPAYECEHGHVFHDSAGGCTGYG